MTVDRYMRRARHRLKIAVAALHRFNRRFTGAIDRLLPAIAVLSFIASIGCLVCFTISVGFDNSPRELSRLRAIIHASQVVFLLNIISNILFNTRRLLHETRPIKWIVDIGVLVTLLPLLYPRPVHPWLPFLADILYSNHFLYPVLTAYSIVDISRGVMSMLGRRTNPSLMLSISFLIFILIGSLLLMLPNCTVGSITYVQSLFVSTSAVCITGLTPVDVSATFTPLGLVVIACLVQIGGLGVLTFTSFFALFFAGNTSLYSQMMVRDLVYTKSMKSLLPTLLYIFIFTLIIETVGAVAILLSIHGRLGMTLEQEIYTAAFNSLSAFCNAGFSNIPGGMSNPVLMQSDQSIYWSMSLLIILGSIGFPILVNYHDIIVRRVGATINRVIRHRADRMPVHLYDMNTKIVLLTFGIMFVLGAVSFLLLERNNTLAGMGWWQAISQSVFNSVVPRSAGFASVDPSLFLNSTLIIIMFLMWIGGASQSTAGGIKVNTFAAICINLRSIAHNQETVNAFGRRIALSSMRRANAVVALSIITYFFYSVTILTLEPALPARDLLFETASALFTVGSSLGVTSSLGDDSLLVLCTAMFIGRVGVISLMTGIVQSGNHDAIKYPTGNIIIN